MSYCTAKRTNGAACKGQALTGASVCRVHGGSAPQVIAAARRRLLMMIDPALGVLARATRTRTGKAAKNWEPSAQEIAAAREVLTRAGVTAVLADAPTGHDGQVLWEEFIQIHRRAVQEPD